MLKSLMETHPQNLLDDIVLDLSEHLFHLQICLQSYSTVTLVTHTGGLTPSTQLIIGHMVSN